MPNESIEHNVTAWRAESRRAESYRFEPRQLSQESPRWPAINPRDLYDNACTRFVQLVACYSGVCPTRGSELMKRYGDSRLAF